jgi:hypothetical protein
MVTVEMSCVVFMSHASEDQPVAAAICDKLESAGIRCWIAPRDIPPGEVYAEAIVAAISQCRIMVVVFSSHANRSAQVLREVERAVSNGRVIIIPYRIESVPPSGAMEYFLSSLHWIDAFSPPIESHMEALGQIVRHVLGTVPQNATG